MVMFMQHFLPQKGPPLFSRRAAILLSILSIGVVFGLLLWMTR